MIRTPEEDLEQELKDPEYAKLYGASDAKAEIAITLATARHTAKKTQKELADIMGLSQPYVARLEGGDANPTIGTIGSILAMLGYRLVTQTAPLKPEPLLSTTGVTLMRAADAVNSGFYDPPVIVGAGTVLFTLPIESARYRAREVVVA